jgi:hypothetical protein
MLEPAPAGDGGTATATVAVVLGVLALFLILVVALWQFDVFEAGTSGSDAQIVAAMIALVGGMLASAFTLVGVLLKHSIDRQTARLAAETEQRLALETSIRAVELLTMPDGSNAPGARQAGALFVLGSQPLRQLDLALALLEQQWEPDGNVSASAAVWVVDQALRHGDADLQNDAATVLASHVAQIVGPRGDMDWPSCVLSKWPNDISPNARVMLVEALSGALECLPPEEWEQGNIGWFISQFDLIRRADTTSLAGPHATLFLSVLLDHSLRDAPGIGFTSAIGTVTDSETLRNEIAPLLPEVRDEAWTTVTDRATAMHARWVGE